MRYESSLTSLSWIPSEAVTGAMRVPFDAGLTHYDEPPPDAIGDLHALRTADRFRFANVLHAWIDVGPSGAIVGAGYSGGGLMGSSTIRLGGLSYRFQAVPLPDLQAEPVRGESWVRFTQTAGGRAGMPAPRRVRRAPYVQLTPPLVWTTLSLTLHADGRAEPELTGASRFPRHWVYDTEGRLWRKSGLTDFDEWYRRSFGRYSPWGNQDSRALATEVETALERAMSVQLMRGAAAPTIRSLRAGEVLVRQGEPGTEVYLLLDGVIRVDRDGQRLAEYGPGAILGERALLESGVRTSTVIAVTPCRVASAAASQFDRSDLTALAEGHHREETPPG